MKTIPVDTSRFTLYAASAEAAPVREYADGVATGQQARDEKGLPLWRVAVLFRSDEALETVTVKIPAAVAPNFQVMQLVKIAQLSAFASSDGRVFFSAGAITPASAEGKAS